MRPWFLIPTAAAVALPLVVGVGPAWAGDGYGQNSYAAAQASGGTLSVEAGSTFWTPPAGSKWAATTDSDPPPGRPAPNQPYGCTYQADPSAQQTLGVGGPAPGEWMVVTCAGPGDVDPMPLMWVSDAQAAAGATQVDPVMLVEQAVKKLGLGSPTIEMAPPDGSPQLVGVATWLWINPGAWRALSASASAGPVTTTATATPEKVVWDMGDGDSVTCDGPGTPYDASDPNTTTDCSYTWPGPGSFTVTATIYWSVTWTATGAAGGGNLGVQAGPATDAAVTVTESQAINTASGGGN